MPPVRLAVLTLMTMIAFAGNSVLCRIALTHSGIDAASFTSIRLVSGAVVLWLMARFFRHSHAGRGNWISAFSLFAYAAGFSFAYVSLPAATGALLLFGAVQATMIGHGIWRGERLTGRRLLGLVLAFGGLVGLLLPGLSAPPLKGAVLMLFAGAAWGIYSLRGKGAGDPTRITAGNFIRAALFSVLFSMVLSRGAHLDLPGVSYAFASGAVASGLGYALWYSVLPALETASAATVQLSVPVLAALGGIAILGESVTARFVLSSCAILGGIALVTAARSKNVRHGADTTVS